MTRSRILMASAVVLLSGCASSARPEGGALPDAGGLPDTPSGITVRELLARRDLVGREIDVTGRCLRIDSKAAFGPPPVTRSDWQLADAGDSTVAVWVSGARPADCDYAGSSASVLTVRATVAADSVRQLEGVAVARRYLVRTP